MLQICVHHDELYFVFVSSAESALKDGIQAMGVTQTELKSAAAFFTLTSVK